MSSTTAAAASDDKVDVSFATDDEEEETSSSAAEESGDETSSSSESDDGDGDADDEGDEMPTFTLSLQPSTTTDDADDALPDLSRSATKQETVSVVTQVSSLSECAASETVTKTIVATSQSSSSTRIEGSPSAVAVETPLEVTTPAKDEAGVESSEGSEESEESEEETEDEEEEEQDEEEQNLPSSSTATSSSAPVSTTIDTKEYLTITTPTKLPVTKSETNVEDVEEEHIAIAVVETKTIHDSERSVNKADSSVTKIEDKHSSAAKQEEKASIKATVEVKQAADAKVDAAENKSGTAATEAAKLKVTNDKESASVSSVSGPDTQSVNKHGKDPADKKATSESIKADTVNTVNTGEADEAKHDDIVKETDEKTTKLSATETTAAKLPISLKGEEANKLKAIEQSETVDNPKSGKSDKTKVHAKKVKPNVPKPVEEEQTLSVTVPTEQNTAKSESEKAKTSKTIITDANPKAEDNQEKTTEVHKYEKSDSVSESTTVVKTAKLKSEKLMEDAADSISQTTETDAGAAVVNGSADVAEKATEPSAGNKLPSKKKSKHSAGDGQESEVKSVIAEIQAVASDQEPVDGRSGSVLEANTGVKSEMESSSIAVTNSELEENRTEAQPNKEESVAAAIFSDEAKVEDSTLNGVTADDGKSPAADDAAFRPRRNSIDEFIKRILAEAREEQKKILDSCAVSPSAETTTETSGLSSTKAADGLVSYKDTEPELQQQQQQPVVNGLDVGPTTRTTRRTREDFDIDDELADISRYFAKRTLVDHVSMTDEDPSQLGSGVSTDDSKVIANGDDRQPLTSGDEPLHFVPQRRESTAAMVRESSRPVRVLVDQQTSVIRQLGEASRAIDELDNEIRQLRQSVGGREALYASVGTAVRDELRIYEMELTASAERLGQQRLPGGGRFIREQFVAQCATELLHRSAAVANGPRLDRAASVDDWSSRVGRRRSGSFSSAAADEDAAGGARTVARQWMIPTSVDRDPTELMIQLRHSRSASVASDRGYSSNDTVDESRATTSSLLSRLTAFNGSSSTAAELDLGRYSRASSEARPSYSRSHSITDDWLSTGSHYTVARQYVGYVRDSSSSDTNGELDVGYRVSAAARPPVQPSYRRYQPPLTVDASPAPAYSRLHVRRGSLQSYASYDTDDSAAGRSFNSRFLSRVREKKALGETSSLQTTSDRPFRSRFLKSSSVSGGSSTSTTPRSSAQYQSEDD